MFYNGVEDKPAIETLRLSHAFINPIKDGEFEWTATVYNLNKGKNDELLRKCKPLSDYMEFINRVRRLARNYELEEAVSLAVNSCIEDGVMANILKNNKAEVKEMVLTEYNEERVLKGMYDDGREEGIQEGMKLAINNLMKSANKSFEEACDMLGVSDIDRELYK